MKSLIYFATLIAFVMVTHANNMPQSNDRSRMRAVKIVHEVDVNEREMMEAANGMKAKQHSHTEDMEEGGIEKRAEGTWKYGCCPGNFTTNYGCHPALPGYCCPVIPATKKEMTACSHRNDKCFNDVNPYLVGECRNVYNGHVVVTVQCSNGSQYRLQVRNYIGCGCAKTTR